MFARFKQLCQHSAIVLLVGTVFVMETYAGDEDQIEAFFEQLKSGNVANETEFITENLLPFGQTAIDVLMPKLEKPRVDLVDNQSVENLDILPVSKVFGVFGDIAFTNLLANVADTNDCFRANVLALVRVHEREECFGVLTNTLNDTALVAPGDYRSEPLRICDEAYFALWLKIKALDFTLPHDLNQYYGFTTQEKDQKIAELKAWWDANGAEVIERFRQQ